MRFETEAPDSSDEAWARDHGFSADRSLPDLTHLEALKRRLLGIGGWAVILIPDEPDVEALLERGSVDAGDGATIGNGLASECHHNAAVEFLRAPGRGIATGYALSRDGRWRQHSWSFNIATLDILETTERRVAYYGIRLDDADSLIFCTRNLPFVGETEALLNARLEAVAPETKASFLERLGGVSQ